MVTFALLNIDSKLYQLYHCVPMTLRSVRGLDFSVSRQHLALKRLIIRINLVLNY